MDTLLTRTLGITRTLLVVGLLGIAACGEDTPADPGDDDPGDTVGPPASLAFTGQPMDAEGNIAIGGVQVAVLDSAGQVVTDATTSVTIRLAGGPDLPGPDGVLSGSMVVDAVDGLATFGDLRIDRPGDGYRLEAAATSLDAVQSDGFGVSLTFAAVEAGADMACGRTPGGTYCWGRSGSGQLGAGTEVTQEDQSAPVLVQGGLEFIELAPQDSYSYHVCGVVASGQAYCWGENDRGQLGDGALGTDRHVPTPVSGGHTFATLSPGRFHTCGVASNGDAYCWGYNVRGQLGDGQAGTDSDVPVAVAGGGPFVAVAGARDHTCGIDTGGAAWCWGDDRFGQLGDANDADLSAVPVLVAGGLTFVTIDAGDRHTCGLTAGQQIYCWGLNGFGKLGAGSALPESDEPVLVTGGHTWARMDVGAEHTCSLDTGGAAWCWGNGTSGQLGTGGTPQDENQPVPVAGGLTFTDVSAGEGLSCGLTVDGLVYCWGVGSSGQLGDGTTQSFRNAPGPIVQ